MVKIDYRIVNVTVNLAYFTGEVPATERYTHSGKRGFFSAAGATFIISN